MFWFSLIVIACVLFRGISYITWENQDKVTEKTEVHVACRRYKLKCYERDDHFNQRMICSNKQERQLTRVRNHALIWPETLVRSRRLSCALGDSRTLSATHVHSRWLSCTLGDSRALSAILGSRRLSCALSDSSTFLVTPAFSRQFSCAFGDTRVLLATIARSRRLLHSFGHSRTLSATFVRSRRLSYALGDSRVLSATFVRSWRLLATLALSQRVWIRLNFHWNP